MGAIITLSGQTQILAGITRLNISGQDSFQLSSTDGWTKIRKWLWSITDGTQLDGAHVSWKPQIAATHTVTLTTVFKDGTISQAQATVIVAATPTFAAFTKYVDSTRQDDSGDGNTPLTAYKTMQKARDVWTDYRGASSTGFPPGRILVRTDGTFPATGALTFKFGPLFIGTYGTGVAPNVLFAAGSDFGLGSNQFENLYDNWIASSGVNWTYAAEHANNLLGMGHVATQLENAVVSNSGIYFVGAASSISGVTQTKGWRYGLFRSGPMQHVLNSTFTGSGHDGNLDHQTYSSAGVAYGSYEGVTTDATGANAALDGFKTSGCNKLYFKNCRAKNSKSAFDVGGNLGEECRDLIYDNCVAETCLHQGWWLSLCSRISVRNPQVQGGIDQCVLEIQNYSTGTQGFEVLDGSFYGFTGRWLRTNDGNFSAVTVQNNAVFTASAGIFFDISGSGDLAKIASNFNDFWRTGGTQDSDATFALIGGGNNSFANWQNAPNSEDVSSKFRDPLFNAPPGDLALSTASPCIDAGTDTGIAYDAIGNARPIGANYDIGAFESIISSGGRYTFRQYAQTFQVGTSEIGFESQAAADAGVRQAIADNPICGVNGLPWTYPGTDNALPNHLFVRRFARWERGLSPLKWFIQAGQDDGTEAHETAIPGYAIAVGYDATLQAIMNRYATDVGDPSIASKSSHYEIVWRKKQKALDSPPKIPLDTIVIAVLIPAPMMATVYGGTNFVPVSPIYCETDTTVITTGGSGNVPVAPIWCESSTTVMSFDAGSTLFVHVKKIWSNGVIFQLMTIRSPGGALNTSLDDIFCEAVTNQMDFSVVGGDIGVTLQTTWCETDVSDMDSHVSSTTTGMPVQPIWCEAGVFEVMPYLQVSTLTFVPLTRIYCETATLGPLMNFGGNLNVPVQRIWCESFLLTMSITDNGAIAISMQPIWCESSLSEMTRTEIDPQVINIVPIHAEVYAFPMDVLTVSTPQAVSSGELSGEVEFEEDF